MTSKSTDLTAADTSSPPAHPFGPDLRDKVRATLADFSPLPQPKRELRRAGVAIVLTPNEAGETCFLITRRAAGLRRHSHQWALPGGRVDDGETALEAALRETHEEVGLRLEPPHVLGHLDDFATRSGFRMSPFVVWAEPGQPLAPDPVEVEQLHVVPIKELESPEIPILEDIPESDRPVLSIPLLGQRIFSPTAAILYQFREVILAGRPTRVSHYEQPVFAWK